MILEDVARETSPAAKSEEKRLFSQAIENATVFFKLCREVGVRPKCSSSPGLAVTSCATSLNFITMEVPVVGLFQYLILQNLYTSDLLLGI